MFIYINIWVLNYKWSLQEKKKQESTWFTFSEEQEIEMEDANIESFYFHNESVDEIELVYSEVIAMSVGGY